MTTMPCPGCGTPRATDDSAVFPCPVCKSRPASEHAVAMPPRSWRAVPVLRWRRVMGLGCCTVVIIGVTLAWSGPSPRSIPHTEPDAAPAERVAFAGPPIAAFTVPAPVVPTPTPHVPVMAAPIPPAQTFTSPSSGLEMILVESGEFQMGSWSQERGRKVEEVEHRVRITRPYFLGIYEVTQDEFTRTMGRNPSWFSAAGAGRGKLDGVDPERLPVEMVSWFDAIEFCNRLSAKDGMNPFYELEEIRRENDSIASAKVTIVGGHGYRLPTEAEWEFACRAGTKTPYFYGSDNTGQEANIKAVLVPGGYGGDYPRWKEVGRTAKVGSYPGNRWRFRDLHGNVAEWCWDYYEREYYRVSPVDDPAGPDIGHHRVIRGGAWMLPEASARSATRFYLTPDDRKNYVGFRVARTP